MADLFAMFRRPAPAIVPLEQPKAPLTPATKGGIGTIIALALLGVYVNEGGFIDDPADRGGATRYGITESVARSWGYSGAMRDFPKHCDDQQRVCSDRIYQRDYMERPGFMPMATVEPAVFYEMVDSAVLHGPARSSGWFVGAINGVCRTKFKPAVKVSADHIKAYADCAANLGRVHVCKAVLDAMDGGQKSLFNKIVSRNPSQGRFYRGWTRTRLNNVPRSKCGGHI